MYEEQHEVYATDGTSEAVGFACRRCSLWARVRELFAWFSCPPPGGK